MKVRFAALIVTALVSSACGNALNNHQDSSAVDQPAVALLVVADVKLDPATGRGSVVNPCLAEGQTYEPETNDLLEATTGRVEIRDGGGATLATVQFLVSRKSGGSLEIGPLVGFFDQSAELSASRDLILLPHVEGAVEAVVVVEGTVLEPLEGVASLANLEPCTGTTDTTGG